ncbi:MAG: gluconokinase [Anaerolinea sp.]|nr:gluconokinase [Anaerolinea sp.]
MNVLILDVGSSSVRAIIFSEDGAIQKSAKVPYKFTTTPPGAAVIDAEELRGLVERCLDEVLVSSPEIAAVGIDTFVGNVLGVDGAGRAVTPIYTYADTRSADDVIALRAQIDVRAMHERTGVVHHTAYLPARLHWLRRVDPVGFASAVHWIDAGTYLYRRWFGDERIPMSYSVASWSGMLNRESLGWDARWLTLLDLPESLFPALADYTTAARGLVGDYARRWRTLAHVPFFLAVGDGAAANIGSDCDEPNRIALTLGTTAALRIVSNERRPHVPFGLWHYRVDAERHLIGGATTEGGNIFQWARETLRLDLTPDLDAEFARRPADGHGLTFLPLLAGERSPGWSANATGTIAGLRLSTTPFDLLQAALEGVALRLATIADQLATPDAAVIGSGGALSPVWAQIIADALNRPVSVLASEKVITAWGTARLVYEALGVTLGAAQSEIGAVYSPRPDQVVRLAAAKQRQHELYRLLYA